VAGGVGAVVFGRGGGAPPQGGSARSRGKGRGPPGGTGSWTGHPGSSGWTRSRRKRVTAVMAGAGRDLRMQGFDWGGRKLLWETDIEHPCDSLRVDIANRRVVLLFKEAPRAIVAWNLDSRKPQQLINVSSCHHSFYVHWDTMQVLRRKCDCDRPPNTPR